MLDSDSDAEQANKDLESFATIMSDSGMIVQTAARSEKEISIAVIKEFERFYLDELTFGSNENNFPPDVSPGIQ